MLRSQGASGVVLVAAQRLFRGMALNAALVAPTGACCLCRNFRIQNQLSWGFQCDKNSKGGNMDLLICNEVLYKDHQDDDLGLGGLRSLPGKPLIFDLLF